MAPGCSNLGNLTFNHMVADYLRNARQRQFDEIIDNQPEALYGQSSMRIS